MTSANRFIKSATNPSEYPPPERPEIALVGRSNSGKSSLLNAMVGEKGLAKVSATPGKTRLLNFFEIGLHYGLVDLPGYGFAVGDKAEVGSWRRMIETFLVRRETLVGLLLICDIRRKWEGEEQMILEWAQANEVPVICVLNKIDKLSQNEISNRLKEWANSSGLPKENFFTVSALRGKNVEQLEELVFDAWVKPAISAKL
jgi:GTP-binding protein